MLEDIDKYDAWRVCDSCGNRRKICKRNQHYASLLKQTEHLCSNCGRKRANPNPPSRKGIPCGPRYWPMYMRGQNEKTYIAFDRE